ncbi:unnamed protein product [Linum trigynum]
MNTAPTFVRRRMNTAPTFFTGEDGAELVGRRTVVQRARYDKFWEGVRRRRVLMEDNGDAKAGSGRVAMRRRLGAGGRHCDELDEDEATGGEGRD